MLRTSGEQGKTWGEKWDNQKTKMRRITTHEELRELYGEPVSKVENKIHQRLNRQAIEFIARSPLMLLATSDEAGGLEVSPRGDRPGFVRVEGDNVLLIPDRTGNRLLMGMENILRNPSVGLIFLVPRTVETLRVHGTAELYQDDALQSELADYGKNALLITRVLVSECFFHCGKALVRSHLWQPEKWGDAYSVNWALEMENTEDPAARARWEQAAAVAYRDDL